jgi:hypothetical protein
VGWSHVLELLWLTAEEHVLDRLDELDFHALRVDGAVQVGGRGHGGKWQKSQDDVENFILMDVNWIETVREALVKN